MAKYEIKLQGNFDDFLNYLNQSILQGSTTTYEDGSDFQDQQATRIAVRVYERYSVLGSNRVSLNITLVGMENNLYLSAITSGGSQALFFKINTLGEESFLNVLRNSVEKYKARI